MTQRPRRCRPASRHPEASHGDDYTSRAGPVGLDYSISLARTWPLLRAEIILE
jgi:hypothetical protein